MTIAILALVLGLVIATAAIGIPRVVAVRKNDPEYDADSRAATLTHSSAITLGAGHRAGQRRAGARLGPSLAC